MQDCPNSPYEQPSKKKRRRLHSHEYGISNGHAEAQMQPYSPQRQLLGSGMFGNTAALLGGLHLAAIALEALVALTQQAFVVCLSCYTHDISSAAPLGAETIQAQVRQSQLVVGLEAPCMH